MKKKIIMISLIPIFVIAISFITVVVAQVGKHDRENSYVALNDGSISTDGTERLLDPSSETAPLSTAQNPSTIVQTSISETSNITTSSATPTECVHIYVVKKVEPTCTSQGYTEHTCSKCGKSYRDAYVGPHDYGKYFCIYCGCPDPTRPLLSLYEWMKIQKNAPIMDNGKFSSINYTENGVTFSIVSNPWTTVYDHSISFEYEKGEEIFRITLESTKKCSIYYRYNGVNGSNSSLSNESVNSNLKINLDYFYDGGNTGCTKEEFSKQMTSKIDEAMKIIQDKILTPKTGLKLKDFGFSSY